MFLKKIASTKTKGGKIYEGTTTVQLCRICCSHFYHSAMHEFWKSIQKINHLSSSMKKIVFDPKSHVQVKLRDHQ